MESLAEYIVLERVVDPEPWLSPATFARIRAAAETAGLDRLEPIHDALSREIDFGSIRIAVACLRNSTD